MQNQGLVVETVWLRRCKHRLVDDSPTVSFLSAAHDRDVEQPGRPLRAGVHKDDFTSQFLPEACKLEPPLGIGHGDDGLRAEPLRVVRELAGGARSVDRRAGVVRGDGEEGEGVLGARGQDEHDAVVRAQKRAQHGRREGERGEEAKQGSMGEWGTT